MNGIKLLILFFSLNPLAQALTPRDQFNWEPLENLAVQDRGRIKPLQTFAVETLQFVTGKRSWKGLSAMECLFGWLVTFDKEWESEPFIRIDHQPLKSAMNLDPEKKYFSPKEIQDNEGLEKLIRSASKKEQTKERASTLEKKALQVANQRGLIQAVTSGIAFNILPNPAGVQQSWFSLASFSQSHENLPYSNETQQKLLEALKALVNSFSANDSKSWNQAVFQITSVLTNDLGKGIYPDPSQLSREIHYNKLRPFRSAWILYTLAFVFLLFYLVARKKPMLLLGAASLTVAFGLHAYGFILRSLIAGRPPVTNMYESVIWVTWGCVLFSLLIWAAYKNAVIPAAASVFAIVGLVLSDNLPIVLDPSINPLEPVLRSNYWLTIHVLTITLSYAAFALSLCLGNVVLGNYLFRPQQTTVIQQYCLYMYRAMQIGVVLLAAGTILGGVWADYSWGRFWGWDPKEVWALTALLLYLAVLHGRFTGWLKGFGFVACTVICFLGVLMAWYGVNFVLGVGLHSYGFGTGGLGWVLGYVSVQVGFILLAYSRFRNANSDKSSAAIFPNR